jgi:hypothetical protein
MKYLIGILTLIWALTVHSQSFPVENIQGFGTTNSTSPTTGAAIFAGGMGVSQNLWVGGTVNGIAATFTGPVTFPLGASIPKADDIRNFGAVCNSSGSQSANNTAITTTLGQFGAAKIPDCTIYVSNITIASGERIYGDGAASILSASGTLSASGIIQCTSCSNISIDHLNIVTTSTQRAAGVSAITCLTCSNVRVEDNTLQGNYGVLLAGSSNSRVISNIITNYGDGSGTNGSGDGIAIQGTAVDTNGYNCGGTASVQGMVSDNTVSTTTIPGSPGSAPTPFGINICGAGQITVKGNILNTPGYFGILLRGTNSVSNTVTGNSITNSTHESIIMAGGSSNTNITGNYIINGAASVDYCLTIDGSQGSMSAISVVGNTLVNCHLSGITALYSVTQSSFVGNSIVNPNTGGANAQAGIQTYGTNFQFNQFAANTITNNPPAAGYGINETTDGISGYPSNNVYMSNSSVGMTTAGFNIQSTSANNNNIIYP